MLQFRGTLTFGFSVISMIFLVFGAVGYCAFGDHTEEIITDNLPDDWTTHTVKIALCLALFFTFPMMMVPVYEVVEQALNGSAWFDMNVAPARRCAKSPPSPSRSPLALLQALTPDPQPKPAGGHMRGPPHPCHAFWSHAAACEPGKQPAPHGPPYVLPSMYATTTAPAR